jgi:PAS domain S-box-containing protein
MPWQYTPYAAAALLAAVIAAAVAGFAWRNRHQPGAAPLALFRAGASAWSVAEVGYQVTTGLAPMLFWSRMEIVFSTVIPLAWVLLVLEYTGRAATARRYLPLLLLEPALVLGLVVTAGSHGLLRSDLGVVTVDGMTLLSETFGTALWAHLIYSYFLILLGAGVLMQLLLTGEELYQNQVLGLLAAASIPLFGNVLWVLGVLPTGLDPTNVGFVFSGTIVAATILRSRLLEIVPLARELARQEIIEDMDDRVLILDDADRVVDHNAAAAHLFADDADAVIGEPVDTVVPELRGVLDADATGELSLSVDGRRRYFDVRVSPLYSSYGLVSGRLVSLRDITERQRREQRLDVLNRLLRHNLRNEVNVIRGNAELIRDRIDDPDVAGRSERIVEQADTIIDRSEKFGRVARKLDADEMRRIDITDQLRQEVAAKRAEHPEADIAPDLPDSASVEAAPSIAVALDELLSNAIEHNDSPSPTVEVSVAVTEEDGREFVEIDVADDGPGIDDHERAVIDAGEETPLKHGSGVGLWLVNWTVSKSGGSLAFDDTDAGCRVSVRLPAA